LIYREKLKQLRINNGWSQDQLADISGLGLRTIQRIEKEGKCSLESKMALASAFSIAPYELDEQIPSTIGSGGINWSGIVGIGMCIAFVLITLWYAGSFTYFIDLNSILFVLIIPFGLCTSASGLALTLRTYRSLSWFIIKPKKETNTQKMLPIIRMLILYCYSSGVLGSFIGFIAIFSNITPTNQDFWTATAVALMPIFWGALLAELAFRPLKHKIEQLLIST